MKLFMENYWGKRSNESGLASLAIELRGSSSVPEIGKEGGEDVSSLSESSQTQLFAFCQGKAVYLGFFYSHILLS